jgi:hypothetical protein
MNTLDIARELENFLKYFENHLPQLISPHKSNNESDRLQDEFNHLLHEYERLVIRQQGHLLVPDDQSARKLMEALDSARRRIEFEDVAALFGDLALIKEAISQELLMVETTLGGRFSSRARLGKQKMKEPTKMGPKEGGWAQQEVKEAKETLPKRRVVNTGFAAKNHPDDMIEIDTPLKTGERYYFWLEVGEPLKESMEETPTELPPVKGRLTVAVFGFKGGLLTTPGADIGELEMQEDGTVQAIKQPLAKSPPKSRYLEQRLFFPVGAPASEGIFRMRCNIYWGQILLQSREIHAHVMVSPRRFPEGQRALRSVLDYTLSQTLSQVLLAQLTEHRLSIMVNNNANGTNSLHVYGSKNELKFKRDDIRFEETKLHGEIEGARGCLRIASWDSRDGKEEWKEGMPFKYQDRNRDLSRLSKDLIRMVHWGREFYSRFNIKAKFEEALFEPSLIQIAMKDSPTHALPAAMIYDYPLELGAGTLKICPSFEDAFSRRASLENHECFRGKCPSRKDKKTFCPSGFWGFRHYLGMPLSVEEKSDDTDAKDIVGSDVTAQIVFRHDLKMVVGVASDLHLLQSHKEALKLKPYLVSQYADTHNEVISLLRSSPHLVYFYCHGALLRDQLVYLQMENNERIFPSNFDDIKWNEPRPLVFMNGCHSVNPLAALDFIEPLVQVSKCAGVIGTEITIYEEMATVFAEEFFRRFLGGEAVGMAVRNARLKLLEEGNPLGLVYVPYAMAGLTLKEQTN